MCLIAHSFNHLPHQIKAKQHLFITFDLNQLKARIYCCSWQDTYYQLSYEFLLKIEDKLSMGWSLNRHIFSLLNRILQQGKFTLNQIDFCNILNLRQSLVLGKLTFGFAKWILKLTAYLVFMKALRFWKFQQIHF